MRRQIAFAHWLIAAPPQSLAPFQMQAAPIRRVPVRFFELYECEVGTVLRDQNFAPHFQGIGEVRAFLVRDRELGNRAVQITLRHQHPAPIGVGKRNGWRLRGGIGEPIGRLAPVFLKRRDIPARADTVVTVDRRRIDRRPRARKVSRLRQRSGQLRRHNRAVVSGLKLGVDVIEPAHQHAALCACVGNGCFPIACGSMNFVVCRSDIEGIGVADHHCFGDKYPRRSCVMPKRFDARALQGIFRK